MPALHDNDVTVT